MKSYNSYIDEAKKKIDKRYRTGQGTKGDQNIRDRDDEEEGARSKTRPTAEAKKVSADDAEHATALYRDQWKDRHIADYDKQHGRADRAKEMRADAEVDRKREYAMDPKWKHAKGSSGEVKGKKSIKGNPKEEVEIDELSKGTLGSYVKKASDSKVDAAMALQRSTTKPGGQTRGDVDKHVGKMIKRGKGIDKAVGKLSKEEVETPKKESIWDTWRPRVYTESSVAGAVALPVSQTGGTSIWDLSNGEVLRNVNAFVGSIADREYLIPENAVHQLKGFMERIGLTFPEGVQLPTGAGSISIPLQRWGGTFGKIATTPFDEFENEPENVGLDLEITVEELRNNSWKVYAKIV